jgi:N-formylglutamate amidohydrolase
MMTLPTGIARFLLLLLIQGFAGVAIAAEAHSLVLARTGNLPILLTAPHGGLEGVPSVPLRSRGTTSTDAHTIELAEAVARDLANSLGAQAYFVAARFSRKFIDANRAEIDAFDSPRAKPAYDAYHGQIRQFIAQIRERFPQGALLLDIHGQSEDPGVVHRGTRNGATVSALLRKHGPEALIGPSSILGVLQGKGYKVFPPNTPIGATPSEDRRYNGGFTVHTHGSRNPDGVDAMQIEVGRDLRTDSRFITALSEGIAVFYKAYLKDPSSPRSLAPNNTINRDAPQAQSRLRSAGYGDR